jgi:hypothetical protein
MYYYTGDDTFSFFKDGKMLSSLARQDFSSYLHFLWNGNDSHSLWEQLSSPQPRPLFFSKIVSVFCLLTNDNYWIVSLYLSFISFVCSWTLVNVVIKHFPMFKMEALFAFLFVPSVVFWGSGLIKECLALAALFYLSFVFTRIWFEDRISMWDIFFGFIALWILWQLKYYYAAIFLPVVVTTLFVRRILIPLLKIKSSRLEVLLWLMILILPFIGISLLKENFHPDVLFHVVVRNYGEFQALSEPGDAIIFSDLKPTVVSILYHTPKALFSGLFRPFIWESHNVLQVFSSVENMFLFMLFIASLKNFKALFSTSDRLVVLSIITYVVLLCVFLTLSTPNFGTLSRYRVAYLPFLVFLISIKNPLLHRLYNFIQRLFSHIVR